MSKNRLLSVVDVHVVLISSSGQWLFSRRANTGYKDGEYSFVAGHLEEGESLKQCAIREAKEEANIDIQEEDLSLLHVMRRDADHVRISFFFACYKWSGVLENMEPNKCSGLDWYDPSSPPVPLVDYVGRAVSEAKMESVLSDFNY